MGVNGRWTGVGPALHGRGSRTRVISGPCMPPMGRTAGVGPGPRQTHPRRRARQDRRHGPRLPAGAVAATTPCCRTDFRGSSIRSSGWCPCETSPACLQAPP
jgi:hypothetical protein